MKVTITSLVRKFRWPFYYMYKYETYFIYFPNFFLLFFFFLVSSTLSLITTFLALTLSQTKFSTDLNRKTTSPSNIYVIHTESQSSNLNHAFFFGQNLKRTLESRIIYITSYTRDMEVKSNIHQ